MNHEPIPQGSLWLNQSVPNPRLERVLEQLRLYEHPLLAFDAREKGDGVEVIIRFKDPD